MLRWIGAGIILVASIGYSFMLTRSYAKEEAALQELLEIIAFMTAELHCRLTTLPELCGQAATVGSGTVSRAFRGIQRQLDTNAYPDAQQCVQVALARTEGLPATAGRNIMLLGKSMGRFDLDGQLAGLEMTRQMCIRDLQGLQNSKKENLRSYQALGFCAGMALVILLI